MNEKYDIFISYRRVDSEGRTSGRDIARTIKLEFEKRGYSVFFDYSEIKDNEFENVILPAIHNSTIFIVVLSKDALLRCSNKEDWVRREIETAIKCNSKIIPISPDGTFDGWPKDFSESLSQLTKQQVSDISMGSLFEKSIDKLEEERIQDVIKKASSKKEDIDLHSLSKVFIMTRKWGKKTLNIIIDTWKRRSIITNIIFCLYILPSILLSFFLEQFSHRTIYFLEVSIGFYAVAFLYCIYQYLLNRRDGVYLVLLCVAIVNLIGFTCLDSHRSHFYQSSQLLFLYSIPALCSLAFRKQGKSTWQVLEGGIYGMVKWKRHFLFYLWCIVWICFVVYKCNNAQ